MSYLADEAKKSPEMMGKIISEGAEYIQKNYDWSSVIKDKYLPFYRQV